MLHTGLQIFERFLWQDRLDCTTACPSLTEKRVHLQCVFRSVLAASLLDSLALSLVLCSEPIEDRGTSPTQRGSTSPFTTFKRTSMVNIHLSATVIASMAVPLTTSDTADSLPTATRHSKPLLSSLVDCQTPKRKKGTILPGR